MHFSFQLFCEDWLCSHFKLILQQNDTIFHCASTYCFSNTQYTGTHIFFLHKLWLKILQQSPHCICQVWGPTCVRTVSPLTIVKKKGFSVTAIWREKISIFRNVDLFELIMLNYNHDYSWLMINHDCTLWLIIDYSWLTWLKYLSIENHNYNKYVQKLD